jgi:hypothetical protein
MLIQQAVPSPLVDDVASAHYDAARGDQLAADECAAWARNHLRTAAHRLAQISVRQHRSRRQRAGWTSMRLIPVTLVVIRLPLAVMRAEPRLVESHHVAGAAEIARWSVTCEPGWFSGCGTQLTARMLGRRLCRILCMYIWKTHDSYLVPLLPVLVFGDALRRGEVSYSKVRALLQLTREPALGEIDNFAESGAAARPAMQPDVSPRRRTARPENARPSRNPLA